MELVIKIDLDNAAFEDGGVEEVARILENLAARLPDPLRDTNGTLNLHDANGNHCGTAEIQDKRAKPERKHPTFEEMRNNLHR